MYFSAHLFERRSSEKQFTLPSRTIQSDLDEALVPQINKPNVLVETSPHRHQGYWLLDEAPTQAELELHSRHVTYSIPDADRTGWSLGHKMRVPGTINHKYASGPKPVRVISANMVAYHDLIIDPSVDAAIIDMDDFWIPTDIDKGVRELWASYRKRMPRRVITAYDREQEDRSAALWALYLSLFRANATRDEVFALAKGSSNNKFADNKYHADLDLAKDIRRAEVSLNRNQPSGDTIRDQIMTARKMSGTPTEKRQYIAAMVRDHMMQHGSFLHSTEGTLYYSREDTGRPISISAHSEQLDTLLDLRYGLNAVEIEHSFTINSIIASTRDRGIPVVTGALSYYSPTTNTMLLHSGGRDVYYIDEHDISTVTNGQMGVVFPWAPNMEPFQPDMTSPVSVDTLFEGCFDNLEELTSAEAAALLKAWLYFILFKDGVVSKPLLALIGQPGSGKSTTLRRVYALLYGAAKSLNSITSADDFDYAVASDPLVVFDNVDTYISWLPDKLALSAGRSDLVKRKLYSDADTVTLRRKALIGLTAHNPRFYREDITDRLIMLTYHRLAQFMPEQQIIGKVIEQRNQIWGGIMQDVSKILRTPQPLREEIPRYRISDFARVGLWISRALGFEADFVNALIGNAAEQVSLNLNEEAMLVDTISNWLRKRNNVVDPTYYTAAHLWQAWAATSSDEAGFRKAYRSALVLGKKLWSLQATLTTVFEMKHDVNNTGSRVWCINAKQLAATQ